MEKAKVYLFTSPTCPHCPPAKKFIQSFKSIRDDFDLIEYSTMTKDGQMKAREFNVMSVPTFIINGPGYEGNIGLKGTQSKDTMNKYIDIALGKISIEEPKKEKKKLGFSIGKMKFRF